MSADREMNAAEAEIDAGAEPRKRLMNTLALESRNALARVELAASELERLDSTPRARDMVETIHSAVGEIDGFLGKIRALSGFPQRSSFAFDEASLLNVALGEAVERIESALLARGVVLEVFPWNEESPQSLIPEATLARLLFAFLRLGLGAADRGARVRLTAKQDAESAGLVWQLDADSPGTVDLEGLAARQLDVESQWAEWGGSLLLDASRGCFELRIPRLPLESMGAI